MDRIAEVIDRLNNVTAALSLKMPAEIHLDCLKDLLPEITAELKEAYLALGGENHWED